MSLLTRAYDYGVAVSSESITVDATTAQGLTVPAGAVSALVTAGANPVRYRLDGVAPTASTGHYVAANGNVEVYAADLTSARFIATTGTSTLFVTYFKDR